MDRQLWFGKWLLRVQSIRMSTGMVRRLFFSTLFVDAFRSDEARIIQLLTITQNSVFEMVTLISVTKVSLRVHS